MRKRTLTLIAILLLHMTGCGGGGGNGGSPVQATKATLKLATSGTPTTIYGIDVTVILAPGVTVKSSLDTHQTDTGVVVPSGAASSGTAAAMYSAATSTIPGKVHIALANADGFTLGEFCTVNSDIAAGYAPKSSDFSLENFSASDANGDVIGGLTPGFTAEIW